jgi:hypothetical protein
VGRLDCPVEDCPVDPTHADLVARTDLLLSEKG